MCAKVSKCVLYMIFIGKMVLGQQGPPAPRTEVLDPFIETIRPAIVLIYVQHQIPNGLGGEIPSGTGFVVSELGHVLTAAHVVRPKSLPENPQRTIRFWGLLGGDGQRREMELIGQPDVNSDAALLRFKDGSPYTALKMASSRGIGRFAGVLALGFPNGREELIPAFGYLISLSDSNGRWSADVPINPGHSGGPVLRKDGRVIGFVHGNAGTLQNVLIPLNHARQVLAAASLDIPDIGPPPDLVNTIPARDTYNDIVTEGSCADRGPMFSRPEEKVGWKCAEIEVPAGGTPGVERQRTVTVTLPWSVEILDIRYFHRSRGDYRRPVAYGPWHTNAPDSDLQWMSMGKAELLRTTDNVIISATCFNSSHNLPMSCALGVQYRERIILW